MAYKPAIQLNFRTLWGNLWLKNSAIGPTPKLFRDMVWTELELELWYEQCLRNPSARALYRNSRKGARAMLMGLYDGGRNCYSLSWPGAWRRVVLGFFFLIAYSLGWDRLIPPRKPFPK